MQNTGLKALYFVIQPWRKAAPECFLKELPPSPCDLRCSDSSPSVLDDSCSPQAIPPPVLCTLAPASLLWWPTASTFLPKVCETAASCRHHALCERCKGQEGFVIFPPALQVGKWQPTSYPLLFYICISWFGQGVGVQVTLTFWETLLRATLARLEWQHRVCRQLPVHAGWQNGEPLDALPAMFSPLQCTLVVEGRASPAKWPSKEGEHLEVKSQLPLHPSSDRNAAEQYKRVSSATATANSFQSNISYKNKLLFSDYELLLCFLHHA